MNTIELPDHTRSRLLSTGTALHLVPMEPQPQLIDGKMVWNKTGEWIVPGVPKVGAVWMAELNPLDTGAAGMGQLGPFTPGETVALAEPLTCNADGTKELLTMTVECTPLRLDELSEEQALNYGIEHVDWSDMTPGFYLVPLAQQVKVDLIYRRGVKEHSDFVWACRLRLEKSAGRAH